MFYLFKPRCFLLRNDQILPGKCRSLESHLCKSKQIILALLKNLLFRPLVTEIHSGDVSDLIKHLGVITQRLCESEENPRTLASRIVDLTSECDILRHTAAQLQVKY